jgi:V8-like Glu-specific endopeptidase
MNDGCAKLDERLGPLWARLATASTVDAAVRRRLEHAVDEAEQIPAASSGAPPEQSHSAMPLGKRLEEIAIGFEASPPAPAGNVRSVVDTLGQIGDSRGKANRAMQHRAAAVSNAGRLVQSSSFHRLDQLGLVLLLATLLTQSSVALAILVRSDRDMAQYVSSAEKFPAVCLLCLDEIAGGTGTLIAPQWVLTAAHVVDPWSPRVGGTWVKDKSEHRWMLRAVQNGGGGRPWPGCGSALNSSFRSLALAGWIRSRTTWPALT